MHSMLAKVLGLLSLTFLVHAADVQEYKGTMQFETGSYVLQQGELRFLLTGMSLSQLRQFEGQQVKLIAQENDGTLEIYKVLRKQAQEYVAAYDWDVVNNELYE